MARINDLQAVSHLKSHIWNLHWLNYSSLFFLIFNDFHGYLDMQPPFKRWLIKESLIISFFVSGVFLFLQARNGPIII
jgi:hypothetical protein